MPKLKPTITDRSLLETYAACPHQGWLSIIFNALKAQTEGMEIFSWEKKILDEADLELVAAIKKVCLQSKDSHIGECGTEIHALIEKAFEECENNIELVPEWFVENLPKIKPNIQPMAIRHARHIADMLSEFHVPIISLEQQISLTVYKEKMLQADWDKLSEEDREKFGDKIEICKKGESPSPAVIATQRLDLLGSGQDSLHVVDYKTGFKRRSNSETADSFQAQDAVFILFNLPEYKDINTIHFWYFETMWGTKAYARFDRLAEHPRLPGLTTEVAVRGRVMATVDLFLAGNKECWPLPDTCAWCDMIQFCPLANMGAKAIADDPKAYVDKMVVMEALLKQMKSAATDWVKGKGAIVGSKVLFTKSTPKEKFTTCFQDKGISKLTENTDEELQGHFK